MRILIGAFVLLSAALAAMIEFLGSLSDSAGK